MRRTIKQRIFTAFLFTIATTPIAFAEEIPVAEKFFSKETGQLYWKINDESRLEFSCSFSLSSSFITPYCYPKLKIHVPDYGNLIQGLIVRTKTELIAFEPLVRSSLSEMDAYGLPEAAKLNKAVYATSLSEFVVFPKEEELTGRNSVLLDTSDIESAIAIQIKAHRLEIIKEEMPSIIATLLASLASIGMLAFFYSRFKSPIKTSISAIPQAARKTTNYIKQLASHLQRLTANKRKAASLSTSSELLALAKLKDDGHITEAEFQALKSKIISS